MKRSKAFSCSLGILTCYIKFGKKCKPLRKLRKKLICIVSHNESEAKKKSLNLYSRWEDANSPFCLILNLAHFCKHFWKFYLDVAFIWNFTVQKRCKIHMRVEYFIEETLDIFNTKINWCKPNCTCELIARVAGTLKKRDFCTSVTSWKTPLQSEKYLSIAPWLIFFKKEKKFYKIV